jgi:hypothetical protein
MTKHKAVFTEILLSEASSDELQEAMASLAGSLLPNIKSHHLTLKFRPTYDEVRSLAMGEPLIMVVTGYVSDHRAQAFVCYIGNMACDNPHPHVTVATGTENGKPIPPKISNDLLKEGVIKLERKFLVMGRVAFSDGKRDHLTLDGSIYQE